MACTPQSPERCIQNIIRNIITQNDHPDTRMKKLNQNVYNAANEAIETRTVSKLLEQTISPSLLQK